MPQLSGRRKLDNRSHFGKEVTPYGRIRPDPPRWQREIAWITAQPVARPPLAHLQRHSRLHALGLCTLEFGRQWQPPLCCWHGTFEKEKLFIYTYIKGRESKRYIDRNMMRLTVKGRNRQGETDIQ
jgi:hypothetical protein